MAGDDPPKNHPRKPMRLMASICMHAGSVGPHQFGSFAPQLEEQERASWTPMRERVSSFDRAEAVIGSAGVGKAKVALSGVEQANIERALL
jgi:hypothetical protein